MTAAELNVSEIAEQLAKQTFDLCGVLLPAGKKDGNEWRVGDVHNSPGKSCAVHLTGAKAGLWSDFASGERGDILDEAVGVILGPESRRRTATSGAASPGRTGPRRGWETARLPDGKRPLRSAVPDALRYRTRK